MARRSAWMVALMVSGALGLGADERDPFERSNAEQTRECEGHGVECLLIDQLDLQGIVRSGEERYAIVMGSDNVGYNLREGDRLRDGYVDAIHADRLVLMKRNEDPLNPNEFTPRVIPLEPGT